MKRKDHVLGALMAGDIEYYAHIVKQRNHEHLKPRGSSVFIIDLFTAS